MNLWVERTSRTRHQRNFYRRIPWQGMHPHGSTAANAGLAKPFVEVVGSKVGDARMRLEPVLGSDIHGHAQDTVDFLVASQRAGNGLQRVFSSALDGPSIEGQGLARRNPASQEQYPGIPGRHPGGKDHVPCTGGNTIASL